MLPYRQHPSDEGWVPVSFIARFRKTHNTNTWKQMGNHESKKPIPASLTDMRCDAHCLFRLFVRESGILSTCMYCVAIGLIAPPK
ncbi:hypothetical protein F2Q70_00040759 [Brassica cretica]|uniref:Uncharacterized protein n=1 Tax=Brassica cretica TaxID=69181 RepID=A0A8S9K1S9_BRACR|nr:hypothetical protein F2Q70_00040759 [Brassica cretica]